MRVLGVDPGTWKIGFAVLDDNKGTTIPDIIYIGALSFPRSKSLDARLLEIHDKTASLIRRFNPSTLAFENIFYRAGKSNFKSIKTLVEGRTVVRLAAYLYDTPSTEVPSKTAKKAVTGNGNCSKDAVRQTVPLLYPGYSTITEDQADAVAVALGYFSMEKIERLRSGS